MPIGHLPVLQIRYWRHPSAINAVVPIATAVAHRASAFAKSGEIRRPPVAIGDMWKASWEFRNFQARYTANIVGMDAADLTNLGAAPVAPALPMVIKSGRAYIATSRSALILPAANLTPIGLPPETSLCYIKSAKLTLFYRRSQNMFTMKNAVNIIKGWKIRLASAMLGIWT